MKFKGKVDWWMHLVFIMLAMLTVVGILMLFSGMLVTGIIISVISAPIMVILLPAWFNTYYEIKDGILKTRCGVIKYDDIDISRIVSVASTKNPISAPALSLDRLEISYRWKSAAVIDHIVIAPADKQGFIDELQRQNSEIAVGEGKPQSKAMKIAISAIGIITAAICLILPFIFIFGEMEPTIIVHDTNVQIRALYGTRIDFDNISQVTLLDQSMQQIGAGARTNGYGGNAWKGHFTAGLLFVRPNSSPTIKIQRVNGSNVFISFTDSSQTRAVYEEIVAALPR